MGKAHGVIARRLPLTWFILIPLLLLTAAAPTVKAAETALATADEIRAAVPFTKVAGPLIANEINQCEGLTKPKVAPNSSRRPDGGYAISPSDLEIRNLQPGTDYLACATFTNYQADGADVPVTLQDVDIRASEDEIAGVDVVEDTTGVGTWVHPSARRVVVPPGYRAVIPYILRTPSNLPAGTVVGGVKFSMDTEGSVAGAITQRIYVTNPGGTRRQLDVTNIGADRVINGTTKKTFHLRFNARNASDYVQTFNATVSLSGLGRTVRRTRVTGGTLMPDGELRVRAGVKSMPWIGLYRPKLQVTSREGTVTRTLPWVIVLPPTWFVIALGIAIALPIVYFVVMWRRRRAEWMQYLEDFDEDSAGDGGEGVDDEAYWDPDGHARP